SMATRATPFSRQNVASASIPGGSLVKRRTSAPGRRTTSRLPEDTSTPQMSLVTVTCLVRASVAPATVRSCVTTAMVPKLTRGCGLRWGGRQSPREGADGHRPPRSDAFTTSRRHLPDTRWGGTIKGRSPFLPLLPAIGFEAIAVGVDDEGGVVFVAVIGARPRLAVVAAARFERRLVEGIDRGPA